MPADSAKQFDIHEAKANWSRIIERVEQGEEIIINQGGTPVAKIVPLTRHAARTGRGALRGRLVSAHDWDAANANGAIFLDFE